MKTILVIEDNLEIRENTIEILELAGYRVLSAVDGMDGVALTLKELPDLILCDIHMPRMSGHEVFQQLRENNVSSSIPFIFATSSAEKANIQSAVEKGADGYLCKPFDPTMLLDEVKAVLDSHSHL